MKTPHPIPYQGSKRQLASAILRFFPRRVETLFEPFAGSAALSLAASSCGLAQSFALNDLNAPLMALWREIIEHPQLIATQYETLWHAQTSREREFYDTVRAEFNRTQRVDYLLYLLARCVKAAVRYNSDGKFNQSPDNRRKGVKPETLRVHLDATSRLLQGRTSCSAVDYREVLPAVTPRDLVYFDPPYQGVNGRRDPRYLERVSFGELAETLEHLNARGISYLVSYDGRTGDKRFGQTLPLRLDLERVELLAGRSSQATLLGRNALTFESLYLSPALRERLNATSYRQRKAA
jgi:DNA adenine methylase